VRLLGVMHMEADLLNWIGDVRLSESEVLQSPSETAKICWVSDQITFGGELRI
jgi:hypothetical protein